MLLQTMLRLLSLGLDNSLSKVFVSSLDKHAPPVVMKGKQSPEHGMYQFNREFRLACCYESHITAGAWYLLVL